LRLRRRDGRVSLVPRARQSLARRRGQLTGWYGATTDIHDHKMAEHALREVDQRKDEFLATLAHELRNPLAPLRNCLHILRMADRAKRRARRHAALHGVMERQVAQLVRLVDDLLEVSRITRGMVPLHLQAVASVGCRRAGGRNQPALDRRRASRTGRVGAVHAAGAAADPVRLAQVLSNLLNNAAKYTEPGGRIALDRASRRR
jgi:signal transduction histidine kinase